MEDSTRKELNAIKWELDQIIRELDDLSFSISRNFKGIGNEKCGNCISNVANKYRKVKRTLDRIG